MYRAELVQFMVNFVVYQRFVVVGRVVTNNVIYYNNNNYY